MIWLTWRQFRAQALIGIAALAVLTAYLVFLGRQIRNTYDLVTGCGAECTLSAARERLTNDFGGELQLTGLLVILVPALIGAFWGAPLIAREIETGTHRLVWNQSITRTRWLSVKLAGVTAAGVILTGALSLLLTWAASPFDKLIGGRFDPMLFPTRNIVPIGYAVFATVAGIAIGLLTRRTVPAMAITLAVFAALQLLLPTVIRPHLQSPVTKSIVFDAQTRVEHFSAGRGTGNGVEIGGYSTALPGAWVLSGNTPLLDATGRQVTRTELSSCMQGGDDRAQEMACLADKKLHFDVTYQPADRYWTFQWLELAGYLVLAGLLAGFVFWRIPRGLT